MIVKAHEQLLEKTNVKFFVIGDNRDENNGGITTMKDFATPNLEEEEQFQLYPGVSAYIDQSQLLYQTSLIFDRTLLTPQFTFLLAAPRVSPNR